MFEGGGGEAASGFFEGTFEIGFAFGEGFEGDYFFFLGEGEGGELGQLREHEEYQSEREE